MDQTNELFNTLSEEEIAAYTADPGTEPHIVIDKDRFAHVPEELRRIAVEGDHNIETVTFDCPRYWDEHDLSKMIIYIRYACPNSEPGGCVAQNVRLDSSSVDVIHFEWTISENVTAKAGNLAFMVVAKKSDAETGESLNRWHSEPNTEMYISKGIPGDTVDYTTGNDDLLTQVLLLKDEIKGNINLDYSVVTNKPTINGVEVSGDKTSADYGVGVPTDEQVSTAVKTYLDEHPEATTTVADGSITNAKLADGAVSVDKIADSAFVIRKTTLIQSDGGMPIFAFPLEGITNATLSVKATITLLSENSQGISLRLSETDSETGYGTLTYGPGVSLSQESPVGVIETTYAVTNKKYLSLFVYTGNAVCDFYIDFEVTHGETKLYNSKITFNWGTGTASEYILEEQKRGALATVDTAKELAAEAAAEAKAYTDESLAGYVYEIPDKNITIDKLSDEVFEIDRECVYSGFTDQHTIVSLDLTPIPDRAGKTANFEFYYQVLNETAPGFSLYVASGNDRNARNDYSMSGSRSAVDEENKIYKVTGTYTIKNGEYTRLNVYPRFQLSEGTNEIKVYGVNVTINGEKLNWVESCIPHGELLPITLVVQNGVTVAKLEHTKQLISEAIGSVEASVNDAKDEMAQLKALIGEGTTTAVESVLNGKKWGVVGDSITFGTGTTNSETTYHKYISEKYLMTISKQGIPGKTVALRPTYNDTLIDNVSALPTDCDFVTVFAGTNDYGNSIALGTFADTTNATFYGAMKLMCEALYARFGGKKFAFFTPTQRSGGNTANSASKTLKDYRDVIIEVCAYYGVPVLDLYAESGINPDLCGDFTGDGLHLNDAGHERISNRIAKFLESL